MQISVETIREARDAARSIRSLLRHAGKEMRHSIDCCACNVCNSCRKIGEALDDLNKIEQPMLNQDW